MVGAGRWDSYAKFYNLVLKTVASQRQQLFQRLALAEPLEVYIAGCGSGLDLPYLPAQSAV
ncbi:class I SAM-dependent methyltransferase, partial [Testudinibacter sp. TR-2022]